MLYVLVNISPLLTTTALITFLLLVLYAYRLIYKRFTLPTTQIDDQCLFREILL